MNGSEPNTPALPGAVPDAMFPVLTPAQQARVAAHGGLREVARGETIVEANTHANKFFVVVTGELTLVQSSKDKEEAVARCGPGMFTGELNVLSGRRGLVRIRAAIASELIEIDREQLLALVQTDTELSDIFLRAFILRRLELVARGIGDVVLIGSNHSLDTFRIKEFLTRNYHPYSYIDLERDSEVQDLLDHFSVAITDLPVLICRGNLVLRNPSNQEISDCLGFNEGIDQTHLRDMIVVGADRQAWPRRFMERRKALMFWWLSQILPAARPVRVPKLKTTPAFQPAYPARISPAELMPRRKNLARRC